MGANVAAGQTAILLIDDDELIAGSLRHFLQARGCAVTVAAETGAAIARMEAGRYAVVVVDPYLTASGLADRLSLVRTTRELQPEASLIVLTAYASPELERELAGYAVSAVLTKPQPVSVLGQIVAAATNRSNEFRQC